MAYYSNSTEGEPLHSQCNACKCYDGCPIALVQVEYNYTQFKDRRIEEILSMLVDQQNGCTLYNKYKQLLFNDPDQEKLF